MFLVIAFGCVTTMLEMLDVLMMSSVMMMMMRIYSGVYRGLIYLENSDLDCSERARKHAVHGSVDGVGLRS